MTTTTIARVMRETHNYFPTARLDGTWSVTSGRLYPNPNLKPGNWVVLSGTNALRQVDADGKLAIPDGTYSGSLYILTPPEDFLSLCQRIDDYLSAHPDPGTHSERFGLYSRSGHAGWPSAFARELMPFRRMWAEVNIEC